MADFYDRKDGLVGIPKQQPYMYRGREIGSFDLQVETLDFIMASPDIIGYVVSGERAHVFKQTGNGQRIFDTRKAVQTPAYLAGSPP